MPKQKSKAVVVSKPESQFDVLRTLIANYVDDAIAESWKGDGDPADVRVLEAQLQLSYMKLNSHIEKMERDYHA